MKQIKIYFFGLIVCCTQIFAQSQHIPNSSNLPGSIKQKLLLEKGQEYSTFLEKNNSHSGSEDLLSVDDYGDPPTLNWLDQFGGSGEDHARDIISGPMGDIYITGSFSGDLTIDEEEYSSIGNWDAYVAKFNSNGDLIWFEQFSASENELIEGYGINLDQSGNILFTGNYTGDVTIGNFILYGIEEVNVFFAKLDQDGNVLLAKDKGWYWMPGYGIKIDSDTAGNIYVLTGGYYFSSGGFLKYNSNGELIMGESFDQEYRDMQLVESSIYFTGVIYMSGYIGDFYLETTAYNHTFIAKSNLDLTFEWAYMAGHNSMSSYSYGNALFVKNNDIYVVGNFRNDINFDNNTLEGSTGYITKCSVDGAFDWLSYISDDHQGFQVPKDVCGNDQHAYVIYDDWISKIDLADGSLLVYEPLDYEPDNVFYCEGVNKINASGNKDEIITINQTTESLTQNWEVQIEGTSAYSGVKGMATDQYGFIYVWAYASNTIDYHGQTIDKGRFIAKHYGSGNLKWLKKIETPDETLSTSTYEGSYIVADTNTNNIYIADYITTPINVPSGPNLYPGENGSVIIMKYHFNGTFQWVIEEEFNARFFCLTPDQDGNVILSGVFSDTINIGNNTLISQGSFDVFVAKYNEEGNLQWAISAGGLDYEYVGLISTDLYNNIYLTGEFPSEDILINNYSITLEEGDGNILLAKLDPNGNVLWATSKAGSTISWGDYYCWPTSIQTDLEGNSYIKGWFKDSTYFDNILLTNPYVQKFNYFIAKFDNQGNIIWANPILEHNLYGFDYNQMDLDKDGNVYLGAQIRDTIHFGNDFTYINQGECDLFTAKYSSSGNLEWVKTMVGNSYRNYVTSVAVCNESCVYIGGNFLGELEIWPFYMESNNYHGFITLLGENIVGFQEVYNTNDNEIKVQPNPFSSETTFSFYSENSGFAQLCISDINGREVFSSNEILNPGNQNTLIFNGEFLAPGVYFYSLDISGEIKTGKMVISR